MAFRKIPENTIANDTFVHGDLEAYPTMQEFNQSMPRFGMKQNERATLLSILLDTSASMNNKMPDANMSQLHVMNEQFVELLNSPAIQASARTTYVSIIAFGGESCRVIQDYTLLADMDINALKASLPSIGDGRTPMGSALLQAVEMGDAMRKKLKNQAPRRSSYAPIVCLFTDGYATDDMGPARDKVDFLLDSKGMQLLCFGIGHASEELDRLLLYDRYGNGSGGRADVLRSVQDANRAMTKVVMTTLAAAHNGGLELVKRDSLLY